MEPAKLNTSFRVSCTNCCVVGCHNNYTKTDKSVSFYRFPALLHEKQRRTQWINAVNRQKSDGKSWEPKPYSRICSQHFVGNKKSNHPHNPAFIPTIFPEDTITVTMDSSESEPPQTEKSHNKFKRKHDALDNEQEPPEMILKRRKNAERCKRYRERKKAEALELGLNKEQEKPIKSKKERSAERSKKYRELKKIRRMQQLAAANKKSQMQSLVPQHVQVQPSAASIRHIKLRQENTANFMEDIISGGELCGEHINIFQDIIASRFVNFRPIDVHLISLPQFIRPISHLQKHIQIISGVSGQIHKITHWICTYYDGNVLNIYDGLNMGNLYPEMEIFLNQLFPHKPQQKFHRVGQQPNNADCGVYAIAFATSLLNNRDPSKENYHHPKMRSHLLDIYSTTELLPFPAYQGNGICHLPVQDEYNFAFRDVLSKYKMPTLLYSEKFANTKSNIVQKCQTCPYFTTSPFLMMNHTGRDHSSLVPFSCESSLEIYSCDDCNFKTSLTISFKRHIKKCHLKDPSHINYEIKSYKCRRCKFETHFVVTWLRHTVQCQQNAIRWYHCEKCSFKTKYSYNLKIHKKYRHIPINDITWYKCKFCSNQTKTAQGLKQHVLNKHSGDKVTWYQCEKCPYKAIYKARVKVHMVKHAEARPKWYQCEKCAYKSKHRYMVRRHLKLTHNAIAAHSDDKITWYQCGKCAYKSKLRYQVKRHLKNKHKEIVAPSDDKIKWYKCEKCAYKSKRKSEMTNHMKYKHSETKRLKCDQCSFESVHLGSFKRHVTNIHLCNNE
ncbi:uncharacterized protein LOC135140059 [Zophobas morio]|uniref:uncharacterized protein LOC135140059 n=1 Tax=Zophobas morio TaxID=2755281 RepID=UPI003082C9F5